MADETANLALPYIMGGQAQKHVTHNESLRILDGLVQLSVVNRTLTAPPVTPAEGARYIPAPGASGAWTGWGGSVAYWVDGQWLRLVPQTGWLAWVQAEAALIAWSGSEWVEAGGGAGGGAGAFDSLGIGGATADSFNRLAVNGQAAFFNSGTGFEVTINKGGPANDAAFAFKTAWAARALFGLLGSDDFTLKASDGSSFFESLVARSADGIVRLPSGLLSDTVLRDSTDPTKGAQFVLSGITAGQTRAFTLPNTASEIAILAGTQTFTGNKTFSGTFTVSAATATLGTSAAASTVGVGTGATTSGVSKTVNLGTGGLAGSTTTINLGPVAGDATVNLNAKLAVQGQAVDPAVQNDGDLWHNSATGQIRAKSGGTVRVLGGAMVPFVTPASGSYIRTDSGVGTTTATLTAAADRMEIFPWVCRGDVTINSLWINCTTLAAGALAKVVVYDTDANGRPAGRLTETGTLDLSTTGQKSASVSLSFLEGRVYWFGVRYSAAVAVLSAWQPHTTPNIPLTTLSTSAGGVYRRTLAFATAAPATWGWTAAEGATGNAPAVWLRIA